MIKNIIELEELTKSVLPYPFLHPIFCFSKAHNIKSQIPQKYAWNQDYVQQSPVQVKNTDEQMSEEKEMLQTYSRLIPEMSETFSKKKILKNTIHNKIV